MKYYNAVQAARRIGVSDKTVRNWIAEGKLHATRTPSNRLGIPEDEVEALRREYAQFAQQEERESTSNADIFALSARLLELEYRCQKLEQRVAELEQAHTAEKPIQPSISTLPPYDTRVALPSAQKRATVASTSTPIDLPPGTMLFADFAEKYGVSRSTFSHHIRVGIAGERIETTDRPKPGRPDHTERWLTPAQQEKALAFWDKYGVRYTRPNESKADTNEPAWYIPEDKG
jgi:excisionase family DNA binding protein